MRYAQIRKMDISNGPNIGISLFVQGCPFHCKNCFNSETWDFDGGSEWTEEKKDNFLNMLKSPHIHRVSILGGEPLAALNVIEVDNLIKEIRKQYPNKMIVVYSGYTFEDIINDEKDVSEYRKNIIKNIDILVDGPYVDELRDISLKWRGSSNQRVIDCKASLEHNKIVLWCD